MYLSDHHHVPDTFQRRIEKMTCMHLSRNVNMGIKRRFVTLRHRFCPVLTSRSCKCHKNKSVGAVLTFEREPCCLEEGVDKDGVV